MSQVKHNVVQGTEELLLSLCNSVTRVLNVATNSQVQYSGIVQRAIGIPVNLFTGIFALARTVGWIAQLNEQMGDPEYKIGRPRQLFTGSVARDVKPLNQR